MQRLSVQWYAKAFVFMIISLYHIMGIIAFIMVILVFIIKVLIIGQHRSYCFDNLPSRTSMTVGVNVS